MVVYNLYIFNRNGQCVFYREWLRRKQTNMTQDEVRERDRRSPVSTWSIIFQEFKLMGGFIFSVKSFVQRLSPLDLYVVISLSSASTKFSSFRKEGFLSFKTNCYKLNYYETPTGLKLILNTDQTVGNIRDILHQLYSTVSVRHW